MIRLSKKNKKEGNLIALKELKHMKLFDVYPLYNVTPVPQKGIVGLQTDKARNI